MALGDLYNGASIDGQQVQFLPGALLVRRFVARRFEDSLSRHVLFAVIAVAAISRVADAQISQRGDYDFPRWESG
jgi:hypothetical protein